MVSAKEEDGIIYLFGTSTKEAELVVDYENGVILKNRRGPTRGRQGVRARLLLNHARAFEFFGFLNGIGFTVRADLDATGSEFWGVLRHYGNVFDEEHAVGLSPSLLLEGPGREEYAWTPWTVGAGAEFDDDYWSPVSEEHDLDVVSLALDICEGVIVPREIEPYVNPKDGDAVRG